MEGNAVNQNTRNRFDIDSSNLQIDDLDVWDQPAVKSCAPDVAPLFTAG
jgi:hypothetical protein